MMISPTNREEAIRFRESLRRGAQRVPRLRKAYLWARLTPGAEWQRRRKVSHATDHWEKELRAVEKIPGSGVYPLDVKLTNDLQPHEGRNFLGYPAGGAIKKDGREVGWTFGSEVEVDDGALPAFQSTTDLETNIPFVLDRYRPRVIFDFGTASGASAVLFHRLAARYCDPTVVSIDLDDVLTKPHAHLLHKSGAVGKIRFHRGDITSDETVRMAGRVIAEHPDDRVLISLDDDHSAPHVLHELELYGPLLRSGDVFLVQDAWNQGLRGSPMSPLLAVIRFLSNSNEFYLDVKALSQLKLPASFVHGLLVKR